MKKILLLGGLMLGLSNESFAREPKHTALEDDVHLLGSYDEKMWKAAAARILSAKDPSAISLILDQVVNSLISAEKAAPLLSELGSKKAVKLILTRLKPFDYSDANDAKLIRLLGPLKSEEALPMLEKIIENLLADTVTGDRYHETVECRRQAALNAYIQIHPLYLKRKLRIWIQSEDFSIDMLKTMTIALSRLNDISAGMNYVKISRMRLANARPEDHEAYPLAFLNQVEGYRAISYYSMANLEWLKKMIAEEEVYGLVLYLMEADENAEIALRFFSINGIKVPFENLKKALIKIQESEDVKMYLRREAAVLLKLHEGRKVLSSSEYEEFRRTEIAKIIGQTNADEWKTREAASAELQGVLLEDSTSLQDFLKDWQGPMTQETEQRLSLIQNRSKIAGIPTSLIDY